MEGQKRISKRSSQDHTQKASQEQKNELIAQIMKMQDHLEKLEIKFKEQHTRKQKIAESNARNQKRILRYQARVEEMKRHRNHPQYFLAASGHMSEVIQEYILAHNYSLSIDPQHSQGLDPDNMSYEQLIELGESIGKVSKGLSKQQIQRLNHRHHRKQKGVEQRCPICQNQLQQNQVVIELRCKHTYHEECILFWLKDENTCPLCKYYLADNRKEEEKMEKLL